MDPQASPNVLLKIEKNIPIPDKVGAMSVLTKTLIKMDVGDSILVGKKWFGGLHGSLYHKDNKGKKWVTRTISPETKRVWRIE